MADFDKLSSTQKAIYIVVYVQFIISIIGILGNILIITVFSRQSLRKYSYSFYTIAKALSDITFLLLGIRTWPKVIFDSDLDSVSQFYCMMLNFIVYTCGGLSQSILAFISFDRVFSVVYSNKYPLFKKRWFQAIVVLITIIFNILISLLLPLYSTIIEIPIGLAQTLRLCIIPTNIMAIQSWIIAADLFFFSVIINVSVNFKLYFFIKASRVKVAAYRNQPSRINQKNDRKLAIVSIGQCMVTFVCKLIAVTSLVIGNSTSIFDQDVVLLIYLAGATTFVVEASTTFFVNFFINSLFFDGLMEFFGVQKRHFSRASKTESRANTT